MFGLINNLYKYLKEKSERKVTIVLLGLDNAGKTTISNTLQGELDKETAPSFGFNSTSTSTKQLGIGGRNFSLQIFDLGGGKNIRRVWKSYLAEVHGVVFVVDAADSARFTECREVLEQTFGHAHLHNKPVLVFANKQDMPTAATAADVAQQIGLTQLKQNRFNILPCTAKTASGQLPDSRLREGLRWLMSAIGTVYAELDTRVQREADEVRAEDARKKKEREELAKKLKEERLRKQREAEEAEQAAATQAAVTTVTADDVKQRLHANALATLPNAIESPSRPMPVVPAAAHVAGAEPAALEFSDLQKERLAAASGNSLRRTPDGLGSSSVASVPLEVRQSAVLEFGTTGVGAGVVGGGGGGSAVSSMDGSSAHRPPFAHNKVAPMGEAAPAATH